MSPPPPPPGTFRLQGRRLRPPAPSERRRWRDGVGGDASRSPWSAISDATIPATTSPNHFPMTGRALGAWRARWTAKAMSRLDVVTPHSRLLLLRPVDSRGFCPQVRIHNHNLRISVLTRTSLPDRPEPPQHGLLSSETEEANAIQCFLLLPATRSSLLSLPLPLSSDRQPRHFKEWQTGVAASA